MKIKVLMQILAVLTLSNSFASETQEALEYKASRDYYVYECESNGRGNTKKECECAFEHTIKIISFKKIIEIDHMMEQNSHILREIENGRAKPTKSMIDAINVYSDFEITFSAALIKCRNKYKTQTPTTTPKE